MQIKGYGLTNTGNHRQQNEDAFLVDNALGLYIVCDGMGGHEAGEVAAQTALQSAAGYLEENAEEIKQARQSVNPVPKMASLVRDAIQYSCRSVYGWRGRQKSDRGLGTTLTLLLSYGRHAVIGHVGDSRLYLLRKGAIHQLTHDHTLVQDIIDRGGLTPETARNHPLAHVLSRAIGVMESVQVDTLNLEILPGDKFLLCTDGISAFLSNAEMADVLKQHPGQRANRHLIEAALTNQSTDNLTAVIIDVFAEGQELAEEEERATQVLLKIDTLQSMYLFKDLSLPEIVRFVDRSEVVYTKRGQRLCAEGDVDDSLYIILEGRLRVIAGDIVVADLGEGSHVGEMAWLSGTPRSASVVVTEDGRLLRIRGKDFAALVYAEPVTGVHLLRELACELARRLASSNQIVKHVC